jgi:hypothetical protein
MAIKIPKHLMDTDSFAPQSVRGFELNNEFVAITSQTYAGLRYMDDNLNRRVIESGNDIELLNNIKKIFQSVFDKLQADTEEKKIIHVFKAITLAVKYAADPIGYDRVSGINKFFYDNGGDCEDWSYVLAKVFHALGFRSGCICLWQESLSGHVVPWVASSTTFYVMERVELLKSMPGYLWSTPLVSPGQYSKLNINGRDYSGSALQMPRFTHPVLKNYRFQFEWISSFEIENEYTKPFVIAPTDCEKVESTLIKKHPLHAIGLAGDLPEYKELYNLTGFYSINRELIIGAIGIAFLLYFLIK